jgi:xanthine dehydrogenase/oxidase
MGGAFGGKETRCALVTLATAIAAKQLQVPVRTVMNRQDDMMATGGRHPFLCKYKVGFNLDGRISAVKALLYSNSGNSMDASFLVLERAIMTLDSGYTIPNWEIKGFACKTNLASNTAFRGFGAPQSTLFCENIFDTVAETLGKSSFEVLF